MRVRVRFDLWGVTVVVVAVVVVVSCVVPFLSYLTAPRLFVLRLLSSSLSVHPSSCDALDVSVS